LQDHFIAYGVTPIVVSFGSNVLGKLIVTPTLFAGLASPVLTPVYVSVWNIVVVSAYMVVTLYIWSSFFGCIMSVVYDSISFV
jgi:hypothetical protein